MFVYIIKPLFTTPGQIIVCLLFIVYTACALYGASHMKDGMKFSQLLSDQSYAKTYFDTLDKEFELYPLVQFIVTEPIPYWRNDYKKRIENLVKNVKALEGKRTGVVRCARAECCFDYVGMNPELEISWLKMINYNADDYPFDNGTKFMEMANGFVNLFNTFGSDLAMNDTHIQASRFYLQLGRVSFDSSDGHLVHQLRSLIDQSQLPITGNRSRADVRSRVSPASFVGASSLLQSI